jgi:hypothetical protein
MSSITELACIALTAIICGVANILWRQFSCCQEDKH